MTTLATMYRPGLLAAGIDHAKFERLNVLLDTQRAALSGINSLLRGTPERPGLVDNYDAQKLLVILELSAHGQTLWDGRDESMLLAHSKNDLQEGHVDVGSVHHCIALRSRIASLQAHANQLNAELAPLSQLVAACRAHVEGH